MPLPAQLHLWFVLHILSAMLSVKEEVEITSFKVIALTRLETTPKFSEADSFNTRSLKYLQMMKRYVIKSKIKSSLYSPYFAERPISAT